MTKDEFYNQLHAELAKTWNSSPEIIRYVRESILWHKDSIEQTIQHCEKRLENQKMEIDRLSLALQKPNKPEDKKTKATKHLEELMEKYKLRQEIIEFLKTHSETDILNGVCAKTQFDN